MSIEELMRSIVHKVGLSRVTKARLTYDWQTGLAYLEAEMLNPDNVEELLKVEGELKLIAAEADRCLLENNKEGI